MMFCARYSSEQMGQEDKGHEKVVLFLLCTIKHKLFYVADSCNEQARTAYCSRN